MFRAFSNNNNNNNNPTPAESLSTPPTLEFDSDFDSDLDMSADWEVVSNSDFAISEHRQPAYEPPSPFADCIAAQMHVGPLVDDDSTEEHHRFYEKQDDGLIECFTDVCELQQMSDMSTNEANQVKNVESATCYSIQRPTNAWTGNNISTMWSPVASGCAHLFTLLSVSVVLCHTVETAIPVNFFGDSTSVVANVSMPTFANFTHSLGAYNVDVAPLSVNNWYDWPLLCTSTTKIPSCNFPNCLIFGEKSGKFMSACPCFEIWQACTINSIRIVKTRPIIFKIKQKYRALYNSRLRYIWYLNISTTYVITIFWRLYIASLYIPFSLD